MKFNTKIFLLLLILIFVVTTINIIAYILYSIYVSEIVPLWFHFIIFFISTFFGYLIFKLKDSHSREFTEANQILNQPKVKYSWHALYFFLFWILSYIIFIIVQMYK
jgi:hypothetical protein